MTHAAPQHIAFIMDGNRRWARANKLRLLAGHRKGADNIRPLVEYAAEIGITYITFWAFSTENWKRDEKEVDYLMDLFRTYISGEMVQEMLKNGVRLQVIGDLSAFPKDIQDAVHEVVAESSGNSKITVTMALNYGGREEISQAVGRVVKEILRQPDLSHQIKSSLDDTRDIKVLSHVSNNEICRMIEKHLYTAGMPDPEIIVRTGGEKRLSGYLPWQSVYSELFFTDTLWPDFHTDEFQQILDEYFTRERRFGR